MKKLLIGSLVVAGFGFSGFVSAAGVTLPSDGVVTTTACELLADQVTINLSANVSAAYQCDTADAAIRIGTCHVAGSRAPRSVTCEDISTETGYQPNAQGCSSTNDGNSIDIVDFSGFYATSRGGSVAEIPLHGTCTDETVGAMTGFD